MAKVKKGQFSVFNDDFLLKTIFANIPMGLVVVNSGGIIVYVNSEASHLIGIPQNILIEQQFQIINFSNRNTGKIELLPFALLKSGGHSYIKSSLNKIIENNKVIPVDLYSFARSDEDKNLQFALFIMQQSPNVEVKKESLHSTKIIEEFFNIITDAAFILDKSCVLIDANASAKEYISKQMDDAIFSYEHIHKDLKAIIHRLLSSKESITIEVSRNKKVYEQSYYPIIEENGTNFLIIIRDITGHKEAEKDLYSFSNYNQLTQLPNRFLFKSSLDKELKELGDEHIAVFNLNIDKFTMINDLLGYENGGVILSKTANLLQSTFGEKGVVGHQGGDEFFVFIKFQQSDSKPEDIAKETLIKISKTLNMVDKRLYITACAGVAVSATDGKSAELLMQNSHSALVVAKSQGPNHMISFSHKFTKNVLSKSKLVHRIYTGLVNDEFFLMYQPKVNAYNGKVIGLEALLRWKTSDGKIIMPNRFIPVAEENGLMVALGNFAMEKLLIQLKEWISNGQINVPVSMNLSNSQQDLEEQLKYFAELISKHGVDPSFVEIEISEKTLSQNILQCKEVLSEFKEIGVLTAIDDFGTVFSSLGYLLELQVDRLILDRSIVGKIKKGNEFEIAAKTIIDLANTFKFSVIAEGAENREQVQFLIENGCPYVQGNYFSEPILEKNVADLLKKGFGTMS